MPTRRAPRRTRRQKQDALIGKDVRALLNSAPAPGSVTGSVTVFGSTKARNALFGQLLDEVNAFRSRSLHIVDRTWECGPQYAVIWSGRR